MHILGIYCLYFRHIFVISWWISSIPWAYLGIVLIISGALFGHIFGITFFEIFWAYTGYIQGISWACIGHILSLKPYWCIWNILDIFWYFVHILCESFSGQQHILRSLTDPVQPGLFYKQPCDSLISSIVFLLQMVLSIQPGCQLSLRLNRCQLWHLTCVYLHRS